MSCSRSVPRNGERDTPSVDHFLGKHFFIDSVRRARHILSKPEHGERNSLQLHEQKQLFQRFNEFLLIVNEEKRKEKKNIIKE